MPESAAGCEKSIRGQTAGVFHINLGLFGPAFIFISAGSVPNSITNQTCASLHWDVKPWEENSVELGSTSCEEAAVSVHRRAAQMSLPDDVTSWSCLTSAEK